MTSSLYRYLETAIRGLAWVCDVGGPKPVANRYLMMPRWELAMKSAR
jgi:hypothetical protein